MKFLISLDIFQSNKLTGKPHWGFLNDLIFPFSFLSRTHKRFFPMYLDGFLFLFQVAIEQLGS